MSDKRTTLPQFDILGRVTGHKQTTDGTDYTTSYTYNLAGALIEETYPSGRVVKSVLDNTGDLSIVQSKKNSAAGYWNYADAFTYNAAGAVTAMQLGNGRWASTTFNSRLQPTQIALGATQGTTNLLKLDYSYGDWNGSSIDATKNNGNIVQQVITVPNSPGNSDAFNATQKYYYDSLNRIDDSTEEIGSQTWRQDFTFDRYGNRNFNRTNTTVPASFSNPAVTDPTISTSNNRLTSTGWLYDNAGNTTRDGNYQTFTYDAENKQVEVKNSSSVTLGQYWYDGDGKRVKKVVPSTGEVTIFVYDAAGKQIAEYSTVVESVEDAKVAYLTADHLGSPRINTDRDGRVTARHDYHPYGEEIITAQRTSHAEYTPDSVRKQFTGYERDGESGLDFAEARYYSKNLGRFHSRDPLIISITRLTNPQVWNSYAYVGNNPLKFVDSLGLELILANQKARDGANRLFSGMSQEERERVQVDSAGRVSITPSEMCGPDTPQSASFAMVQYAVDSDTIVRVSLLGAGEATSLPNSVISGDLVGNLTMDFANLVGRGGTAVPRTDGTWDVLIPEGGGSMAADENENKSVPTTEMTIFNHEIAHPFGLNAIEVENNVRRENGLPLRSGSDHPDPRNPITVTDSSAVSPIEYRPQPIQTDITLRPLIPPVKPPKKPNE
ncbi:MAG: RHS repeat-associated core domain-containing protein [Chloracidobacterium sp.]|nr:RHS repeat-associated core domain-containing protein [Chloracidobacterium sp.]